MALAGVALLAAPAMRAQDNSGQITIADPAEFQAYQNAITQTDPATKASALESFLTSYPQSVVKKAVLDQLIDTYQQASNPDKMVSAASRLLQSDPNNMKAIYFSVFIKKGACQKNVDQATGESKDPQTCDDAAALAQRGLTAPKPTGTSDDDWAKLTGAAYPLFHSAIAIDDLTAKKDYAGAIKEYTTELMLYPADATKGGPGLLDTLHLAQAYAKPGDSRDEIKAVWFYARIWNFAPAQAKADIESQLDYWYKRYHGNLEGIEDVETKSAQTLFPPADFTIKAAPTPPEIVHNVLATTPDLTKLNLEDKEFILANGTPEDTQKLWGVLKNQDTPVPGIVIEASATVIKVAVTQDAKDNKIADFIVNMKTPLADKDIPVVGSEFKLQPAIELDGTYDTFTQVPATATSLATAKIVLRDGFIQPEKKAAPKPAPARRHPAAGGHHPGE
jgi:hypothetical protein